MLLGSAQLSNDRLAALSTKLHQVSAGCVPCGDGWTTDTSGSTNRKACCEFDCVPICVQATSEVCEQGAVRSSHVRKVQQRRPYST
jgi:hypothetical protein